MRFILQTFKFYLLLFVFSHLAYALELQSAPLSPIEITAEFTPKTESFIKTYGNDSIQSKLIIKNTNTTNFEVILFFDHYLISQIQLFEITNNNYNSLATTGSNIPGNVKIQASIFPFFKLQLKAQTQHEYLIKMTSHHKFNTKAYLLNPEKFQQYAAEKTFIFLFFISVLSVIALFTLIIGFAIKDKSFVYYSGFAITMFFTASNFHGLSDFFPSVLGKNISYFRSVFTILNSFFSINFAISYLNFPKFFRKTSHIIRSIAYSFLISIPLVFGLLLTDVRYYVGVYADLSILINTAICLFMGFAAIKSKQKLAIFYLAGWGTLALFAIIFYLGQYGFYQHTELTRQLILAGSIFEMLVLSIGLAYRFSMTEEQKNAAAIKALVNEKYKQLTKVLVHDIANGLNVIRSSLFLMQNVQGKKFSPDLIRIQKANNHLIQLLEHVKHSLKDNYKLTVTHLKLHECLEESIFFFQEQINEKKLSLDIKDINFYILANKTTLINDVLNNVISNAIKFSPENAKIEIWTEDHHDYVNLYFQNFGAGISEENIRQFHVHKELPSTIGMNGEAGTGFGLNLASSYMEHFQGSLEIVTQAKKKFIKRKVATEGTIIALRFKQDGAYALDEEGLSTKPKAG